MHTNFKFNSRLATSLLLLLCFITNLKVCAKDHTVKDRQRNFHLTFYNTTYTYDAVINLHYDDTSSTPYTLTFVDSTLKDDDLLKKPITLTDPLNISNLEDKINAVFIKKSDHSLNQSVLYSIFYWIDTATHLSPDIPLAGTLFLGTMAKYFDSGDDIANSDTLLKFVDSVIDQYKIISIRQSSRRLDTFVSNEKKDSLKNSDPLSKILQDTINNNIKTYENIYKNKFSDKTIYKIADLEKNDIPNISNLQIGFDSLKKIDYGNIGQFTIYQSVLEIVKSNYDYLKRSRIFRSEDGDNYKILDHIVKSLPNRQDQFRMVPKLLPTIKSYEYISGKKEKLLSELHIYTLNQKLEQQTNVLTSDYLKGREETVNGKTKESVAKDLRDNHISKIKRVDMQFERGFLENIKVILDVDGVETIFENYYAIGFTSKSNYGAIKDIRLYARGSDRKFTNKQGKYIILGNVLRNYDNEIDLFTRDYSPADTVVKIDPNVYSSVGLKKAAFINLFETKFFTDFDALANKQPNGLVQIEVARRVNINTKRNGYGTYNQGWVNYLYVYGSENKIENNNRYLPLRNTNTIANGSLVSPSYATTLDFLQYRNFTIGSEANVYLFDIPRWKFTVTGDLGGQYAHTPVMDSSRGVDASGKLTNKPDSLKFDANLVILYPKVKLELFPERRVGLSFTYQWQYMWLFSNNKFKNVVSYEKSNLTETHTEPQSHISHMFEIELHLELQRASSSKLFFRTRLYWQQGDVNTYFPQIQFGYSYNVNFSTMTKR